MNDREAQFGVNPNTVIRQILRERELDIAAAAALADMPERGFASLINSPEMRGWMVYDDILTRLMATPDQKRAAQIFCLRGLEVDKVAVAARQRSLLEEAHRAATEQQRVPRPHRVQREKLYIPDKDLHAVTPAQFNTVLRRAMTLAGLKAGQIAATTSIPRSQAYNLVKEGRTSLPRKESQIREFLQACNLHSSCIHTVMARWSALDEMRGISMMDAAVREPEHDSGASEPEHGAEVAVRTVQRRHARTRSSVVIALYTAGLTAMALALLVSLLVGDRPQITESNPWLWLGTHGATILGILMATAALVQARREHRRRRETLRRPMLSAFR